MVDTTLLQGADATSVASLPSGMDWYLYYTTGGWSATEAAVKAAFPGKKYLGLSQAEGSIPDGTDGLDMENGAWTAEGVAQYLSQVNPVNTNLPVIYCSADVAGTITNPRDTYYLFQADYDDVNSVPSGADLAQYENTPGYDLDVAYAYIFKGSSPVVNTVTLKGTLARIEGTTPVWWLNGDGVYQVPDPAVQGFFEAAGVPSVVYPVTVSSSAVKGTLYRVTGTDPVYWWNGTNLWHVPDNATLAFLERAGFPGTVTEVTASELAALGSIIS